MLPAHVVPAPSAEGVGAHCGEATRPGGVPDGVQASGGMRSLRGAGKRPPRSRPGTTFRHPLPGDRVQTRHRPAGRFPGARWCWSPRRPQPALPLPGWRGLSFRLSPPHVPSAQSRAQAAVRPSSGQPGLTCHMPTCVTGTGPPRLTQSLASSSHVSPGDSPLPAPHGRLPRRHGGARPHTGPGPSESILETQSSCS